jgi:hypothetical protein
VATKTTGKSLVDFWQSPFVETRVSARMAADLATACREVLSAHADGWNVNLRTCPVEDLVSSFVAAHPLRPAGTLATYKSRFRKAVRLYLAYVDDPDSWEDQLNAKQTTAAEGVQLRLYDFPLRHNLLIPLDVPVDITRSEASRLAAFIESLAFTDDLG